MAFSSNVNDTPPASGLALLRLHLLHFGLARVGYEKHCLRHTPSPCFSPATELQLSGYVHGPVPRPGLAAPPS